MSSDEGQASLQLYVHLRFGLDAKDYRRRWLEDREPDETPYGFHLARDLGYSVSFSQDRPNGARPWRSLAARLKRCFFDIDLIHAWRNRAAMRRADVIWTMLETEALAVSALMYARVIPRKPVITGVVWMMNRWADYGPKRQAVYRRLSSNWSVAAVHAVRCLPQAERHLRADRTCLMYFGISSSAFTRVKARNLPGGTIHIVGVGNDTTRDWATLLDAFGNDERFTITIYCTWLSDEVVTGFRNLTVPQNATGKEMRAAYAAADYIVVPMIENLFSGITVALEAAAMGIPLLCSDTGGVDTYFSPDEVLYTPVGNAAAMKAAVLCQSTDQRQAMAELAYQRFARDDYSTRGLMRRYDLLTRQILAL